MRREAMLPVRSARRGESGFSLIELMIAMVLGLIVSGAAIALFFSNSRTYASTENLGRIQENARTAFELMARDIREAAGNTCGASRGAANPPANVLNGAAGLWYSGANGGVRGYGAGEAMPGITTGSAPEQRVAGTGGLDLVAMFGDPVNVVLHAPAAATMTLNTAAHGLTVGDLVMACDAQHGAVFQVSSVAGPVIGHGAGGATPGNCATGLGALGPACGAVQYEFGCRLGGVGSGAGTPNCATERWTATVSRMRGSRWWVGNNDDGGTSLWQTVRLGAAETNFEIAEGVSGLDVRYLVAGATSYVDAATVTAAGDWPDVVALRIDLRVSGRDNPGPNGTVITRAFDNTVTLRNRMR
jgi:type IV pilus assembly protein PilW